MKQQNGHVQLLILQDTRDHMIEMQHQLSTNIKKTSNCSLENSDEHTSHKIVLITTNVLLPVHFDGLVKEGRKSIFKILT